MYCRIEEEEEEEKEEVYPSQKHNTDTEAQENNRIIAAFTEALICFQCNAIDVFTTGALLC